MKVGVTLIALLWLFVVLGLLLDTSAKDKASLYVTPDYWTNAKVDHCKQTSPTTMDCQIHVTFEEVSAKAPNQSTFQVPRRKFEVQPAQ